MRFRLGRSARIAASLLEPEELIRSELFSVERLEQHAESLAKEQTVARRRGRSLVTRLRDNDRVLRAAHRTIAAAVSEERAITPAAEWLVDNFHVVTEQIREIVDDLPDEYYRQLPKLATGPLAGSPRVYGIAWAFVAHTDSLLDLAALTRFVRAYQRVQPLTIGELWAVAITLRIVLVENLRRAALGILSRRTSRQEADALADKILAGGAEAAMATFPVARLPTAFVVQLVHRLRHHDPVVTPGLVWLDQRLAAQGATIEAIVQEEHRRQGATNVTVRNVITSMRLLSGIDWTVFFESVSLVDAILDAEGRFRAMDFPTRDRYRHAIEDLARGSRRTEIDVAQRAVVTAALAPKGPVGDGSIDATRDEAARHRRQDPGFLLIGGGRRAFEIALGFRIPMRSWLPRARKAMGIGGYLATVAVLGCLCLAVPGVALAAVGTSWPVLGLLLVLGVLPASDLAIALVNRRIAKQLGPVAMPGLELADGVPASLRTMVVVPTMLSSVATIDEQVERLEVHHLASPDDDLCFSLLSDWVDSANEHADGDDTLLAAARAGIARLNLRHGPAPSGVRFRLLHRRRVWNAGERMWIGWERKRGKLHELNRWLRGARDTTFLDPGESSTVPPDVRYVLTLDADTRLPRGAARRLVGKMAHPLNRPTFDRVSGRVVEGHAVLQPRITPMLPMPGDGSWFQHLSSAASGLDPYAFAVSDVYQDLVDEGSYTGKGIYEVDAFEAAQAGRVPESTVLSHDLLEGIFARSGLVTDVELVEECPARYDVAAARQHRWARGDWQLLPWVLGFVRDRRGSPAWAAIPLLGRWKLIDNLRRTLVPPAAFLLVVVGWMLGLVPAAITTGFVLATIAVPSLVSILAGLVTRRAGVTARCHLRSSRTDAVFAVLQVAFATATLAHQALLMVDAIVRTLFRLLGRRRRMLEWLTAAQAKFQLPLDAFGFCRRMVGSLVLVAAAGTVAVFAGREAWPVALPMVGLWLAAPFVADRASRRLQPSGTASIDAAAARTLRTIARRTWSFFETFVVADDRALPPDNFQETPLPQIAHRTSPTNIGLYLLSVTAARDFGWIGTLEAVQRIEATLGTVQLLEHYNGHLFNWYDTRTLRPLEPKYVSSVDSGNFAGHLIALGAACREMLEEPVANPARVAGIEDALELTRACLLGLSDDRRTQTVTSAGLGSALDGFEAVLRTLAITTMDAALQIATLTRHAETVADIARTVADERGDAGSAEVLAWAEALRSCVKSHEQDLEGLIPWARLVAESPTAHGAVADPEVASLLATMPALRDIPDRCDAAALRMATANVETADVDPRAVALSTALERSANAARALERRITALHARVTAIVAATDFTFLYEPKRQLLSIGYQVAEGRLDPGCYDLLASEARLASFVAIAKGDVPAKQWFRLGRGFVGVEGGAVLASWSGSLFEYLMPGLVMREPACSLLDDTSRLVVRQQIRHGRSRGVPWGVSESAYNVRDLEMTYQYSSFGVPELGQKRGLGEETVIAPYATALAAMVDPIAAVANFARLATAGGSGRHGFYEALDYTATRLPPGAEVAVVRAYMAHHQGMTVVALGNVLHGGKTRARFHQEAPIQATELLLQERTPRDIATAAASPDACDDESLPSGEGAPPTVRRYHTPNDAVPRTHLLSNGRYGVMLTAAGSGYSRFRELAVTRWREDVTRDPWGAYVFLRDARSGDVWSAGYQPTGVDPDSYEVAFSEGRAEIVRRDGSIQTTLEVAVSPENDAEVRRVSITNLGSRPREIDVTSYAEIVLAPPAADTSHPAFAKLFVQTEYVANLGALVATRRRRSPAEPEIWAAHLAVVEGPALGEVQYETDRARFLGRGRTIRSPISVADGRPLAGGVGTVLDAVFALRHRVTVAPGATVRVAFWTMVGPSRTGVLDLVDKHRHPSAFERAVTLSWTQAQVQLHHAGIDHDEAHLFQRLANRVVYSDPGLRPSSDVLARNHHGPAVLWAHGISGDLPIVLVRIGEMEDLEIVRQLLRAHVYWRLKLFAVDLVIVNEHTNSYIQGLPDALEALVRASQPRPQSGAEESCGRVFVLRSESLTVEARSALHCVARAVLFGRRGSLAAQVWRHHEGPPLAASVVRPSAVRQRNPGPMTTQPEAEFWNGLGGFTDGGRVYTTILGEGQTTPAPWINVVANPRFGFQVSAEGAGYVWSESSRENLLSPWSNDPTSDEPGEVVYVRDLDSGALWCPTASPIRAVGSYVAQHGQGYSRFLHEGYGIGLELLQFVPLADSIKISRLRLHNRSARTRRLSVTAYVEWVLGPRRAATAAHVVTEIDPATRIVLARNPWRSDFADRVAFADLGGRQSSWTCDRTEFVGRNGALEWPKALIAKGPLSKRTGAGFDPCAALQTEIVVEPGAAVDVVFFLGEAATKAEALALAQTYRRADLDRVLRGVTDHWDELLGVVQVQTPDRSMDLLLNRWLLYQTVVCRLWARAAFYQAGGAYGFRDQLQDGMALVVARPDLTREHLLRAAARQFREGDVQHWWLPHSGRGVRTRVADDCLWLVHATAHYVEGTGDGDVLAVVVPFLDGEALRPGAHESYFLPSTSDDAGTLYEHCARALDHSLLTGAHGLPLMGGGDWNDGMNRVGIDGRGESVWMAWFLHGNLVVGASWAEARGEMARAAAWRGHAVALVAAMEQSGWDGEWYRRAFFDDGSPLGAAANSECRIDSIAQSWAVSTGAGDPARARLAMAKVVEHLVDRTAGLVLLFAPPFDRAGPDPGYVQGYPPGIRENGGQYTHAAIWVVMALTKLGDGNLAAELFAMCNPIERTRTRASVLRYRIEPYVVAADIYSTSTLAGRGGWSWYTGSSAWLYRTGLESILGFRVHGTSMIIDPCIPDAWSGFEITYRHRSTRYRIVVSNPQRKCRGVVVLTLDGAALPASPAVVTLVDDGATHVVRAVLG